MQYRTVVEWDPTLVALEMIESDAVTRKIGIGALFKSAIKITTGAPATNAGKFIPGAIIQNAVSGVNYQNTGSTASPTWSVIDVSSGGLPALTNGRIWVGNGSNVATGVTPSGDVTMTNAGVTAIGASKVLTAMINDNAVTGAKIALTSQAAGSIMYYNGTDWVILAIGTASQTLKVNAGATAPEWVT